MRHLAVFVSVFVILTWFMPASADRVYMWKDKDGNVHFGDRPQHLDTQTKDIDVNHRVDKHAVQRNKQRIDAMKSYVAGQKQKADAAKKAAATNKANESKCNKAQGMYKSYTTSQFLYEKDASGKRTVLPAERRTQAINEVKTYLDKHCNK